MPAFNEIYGPWCILAGGAEGLGEAYAEALAQRRLNLLIVDNQCEKLRAIAQMLIEKYGVEVQTLCLDLAHEDAYSQIIGKSEGLDAGLLVYNAAYSRVKPFLDHSPEELEQFVQVNVRTQIKLTHAFAVQLAARGRAGGILLMSSLAGLIGMQLVAPYAATKAFAWNLAEAVGHELKPLGIAVMACIAGATATPAYLKTNPRYGWPKPLVMQPEQVANQALDKLGKKGLFIPGFANRINYFILTRMMPRKLASAIANRTMARMYSGK